MSISYTRPVTGASRGHDLFVDRAVTTGSAFSPWYWPSPIGPVTQNAYTGLVGNDNFTGTGNADTFDMAQGGNDKVTAKGGDDNISFGATLTAADKIDGGLGNDLLSVIGNYSAGVTFTATTLVGIEAITMGDGFSYKFTSIDATVAPGAQLLVDGLSLTGANNLIFDGSAETDGTFNLFGGTGDDMLTAGMGDDTINAFTGGNDILSGGAGAEYFAFGDAFAAGDSINGGTGDDTIGLGGDSYTDLFITGAMMTSLETISLVAGHDYTISTADDVVAAGQNLGLFGNLLGAADRIDFDGSEELDGTFSLSGGAGNDRLFTGYGDDSFDLDVGGRDVVDAGAGDDFIYVGAALDRRDHLDGGANTPLGDSVQLSGDYSAGLTFRANTIKNIEVLGFGNGFNYDLVLNDGNIAAGAVLATFVGGSFSAANWIHIDASAETDGQLVLGGTPGDDILIGGGGSDLIRPRAGINIVDGGGGFDRVTYFVAPNGITIDLNVHTAQNIGWGTVTLLNVEDLSGTVYDDVLTGDAGSNVFLANGGNDTVNGNAGNDIISVGGLDGNSMLATNVQVDGGTGTDQLSFYQDSFAFVGGASFSLAVAGAQVTGTGTVTAVSIENLEGTIYDDILAGNNGANMLLGVDGSDQLLGGDGNDRLYGDKGFGPDDPNRLDGPRQLFEGGLNPGIDQLAGGNGNDVLVGGGLSDLLNGGTGRNIFVYELASDSVGTHTVQGDGFDIVTGFDAANDTLDLWFQVQNVDTKVGSGQLRQAFFDTDMAAKITAAKLGVDNAVLFTPNSGDYNGKTFLIIDANGIAGYQVGDVVIEFDGLAHASQFAAGNFISL